MKVITPPTPTANVNGSEPGEFDILVLDAATKQSLACTRSLGRARLRVALGECFAECDPAQPVPTFRSRYSARNVVLPSYADDAPGFAAGVIEFVGHCPTRVVLPTMDGSIAALAPVRRELGAPGCLVALPSEAVLKVANDKDRTLEVARGLGIEQPNTRRIDNLDEVPAVLAEFEFPIVLKPTISWAPRSAVRLQPVEVVDQVEAVDPIRAFLAAGAGVLAQQWASGRREGVTMFIAEGDVVACCAHVAPRTSPALAGASVMRESVPIPPDIYAAAVSLVKAIDLQGVREVEFRRDASGRPLLMEINARLAGTIENSVHSGVDFPLMIWQWATGQPVTRVESYETGIRTRWLRGDMRWLRDNYRRVGRPDSVSRARSLWTFVPNPEQLSRLGHIRRPASKICEGWHCAFWNSPTAFRRPPEAMRLEKARTVLGPNGSWWLKDRVEGVINVLAGHRVKGAVAAGSGVQLLADGARRSTVDMDHVMAGTGFRIDLAQLSFLPEDLRAAVDTRGGFPVLNRNSEPTVPGLYFSGAPATVSLGPSMRFIGGVAQQIARSLARRGKVGDRNSATADAEDQGLQMSSEAAIHEWA